MKLCNFGIVDPTKKKIQEEVKAHKEFNEDIHIRFKSTNCTQLIHIFFSTVLLKINALNLK